MRELLVSVYSRLSCDDLLMLNKYLFELTSVTQTLLESVDNCSVMDFDAAKNASDIRDPVAVNTNVALLLLP